MISAAPWLINKSVQTEIACVSQQRDATKLKDAQSYGVICFFFLVSHILPLGVLTNMCVVLCLVTRI